MRTGSTFFLFMLVLFGRSQDMTGIWRGHFRSNEVYQRLTGDDDRYKMEVQIAQKKNVFKAITYSYKSTVFYGKAEADGKVDPNGSSVKLKELKIVEIRMMAGDACTMTCFLRYSKLGDEEFLEGTYTSTNTRDSANCGSGSIFLHKVQVSDFYKEPFVEKREQELELEKKELGIKPSPLAPVAAKKATASPVEVKPGASVSSIKNSNLADSKTSAHLPAGQSSTASSTHKPSKPSVKEPAPRALVESHPQFIPQVQQVSKDSIKGSNDLIASLLPIPRDLATRTNELVKTITVNTREVQLFIYDDGTIDNDTVSVYFDKKLMVSNARLTAQPIIVTLHLDESSNTHEVVMVAENLGDIPPNTSLMVVKAGDKRFEVRIVSTEQQNAVVLFKFEKPS